MLAPAERYTTIGVRSDKIRTLLFLLTAAEFKQPKREEETLLFSFVNFGQRRRRKEARVLRFCLTKCYCNASQFCRIAFSSKTLISVTYNRCLIRVFLTLMDRHHSPQNRILSSYFVGR